MENEEDRRLMMQARAEAAASMRDFITVGDGMDRQKQLDAELEGRAQARYRSLKRSADSARPIATGRTNLHGGFGTIGE